VLLVLVLRYSLGDLLPKLPKLCLVLHLLHLHLLHHGMVRDHVVLLLRR
jgi:hypothetical protein